MAAKRGTENTGNGAPLASTAYLIKVAVNSSGNFTYTANGVADASTLRPSNEDTVSWLVTLNGAPVPFQVEFPGFGPFAGGVLVVRSLAGPSSPLTVSLPSYYNGNFAFKYTVSTINGWSDDPIVEPVPSDGLQLGSAPAQLITLSVDKNGDLTLTPEDASYAPGEVTWQWAAGQIPDDFTVTFDGEEPDEWPSSATSQGKILALNLQDAGAADYTLQTLHLGLENDAGTLTISEPT